MKKWHLILAAAAVLSLQAPVMPAEAADVAVPDDIFQWVQSTARQNYYFNKQQIKYGIDAQGNVDLNTLIVPTLRTYDDIQIRDVVTKRRWKMLSVKGYERLIGSAKYLKFNLKAQTVQIVEQDDLDDTFTSINQDLDPEPAVNYATLSEKDVDGCFYRAIIKYAQKHQDELIARTGAPLSKADAIALGKAQPDQGKHKHKKG
ncbi:MAG: hypothetical protein II145_01490 [Selenomonas sp.]|jgi:hypothetical protein|nr:hypothetical protein [Selenomonas sp.]MCI7330158.1 hypothetical protein [Selenomonadaceae bacterium]MDD6120185.1 hypothetical protein [Selenomonadaceae bacterium]MDD7056991.1 hypothetical protein [Selenomonadaceae bacterium]MDY3915258.1 hypothetical protein [Selenomonadaceae bacterium]